MSKPDFAFSVYGRWSFPRHMLKRDNARAATPKDQALIDSLSRPSAPAMDAPLGNYTINLLQSQADGYNRPNAELWALNGWEVEADEGHDFNKEWLANDARMKDLLVQALAKLTPDEIEAVYHAAKNGRLGCPPDH